MKVIILEPHNVTFRKGQCFPALKEKLSIAPKRDPDLLR